MTKDEKGRLQSNLREAAVALRYAIRMLGASAEPRAVCEAVNQCLEYAGGVPFELKPKASS